MAGWSRRATASASLRSQSAESSQGIKVIGRTSSFSFKSWNEDLRAIGRTLGVGTLLQGSVRKEGSRLRITARLVRTGDGSQLWSKIFEREQAGIFAVQEEIAREVVVALRVKLFPGEDLGFAEHRTTDPKSYDYYLMGVQFLRQPGLENAWRCRTALQKALELDPRNARAHAAMAWALEALYERSGTRTAAEVQEVRREALDSAERAVALAPSLADSSSLAARAIASWRSFRTDSIPGSCRPPSSC